MHFSHGDESIMKIRLFLRIRLMNDSLVALSCSTWFIGIDTRDDQNLVRNLILYLGKTIYIIADRIFVICRTWSDDDQKLIGFPGKDLFDLGITRFF